MSSACPSIQKHIVAICIAVVACSSIGFVTTCAAADSPPNIVTVFIDDMGWSDISCFGGDVVQTENIDRLAAEGIRFTNFYVNSPICSPSRVALSTGQYPQRWRVSSYLAHRKANSQRGMAQWLDPAAPMLARELQQAGYATGHFGKWHMGGQRDVGEAPLIQEYGFDRSLTNFEGLGPRVLPLKDAYDGSPVKKHDLGSADLGRGPIQWMDRSQITAEFVRGALEFIDQAQADDKPFYINLWPDDVHSPFFPPKDLRNSTDGSKRALYYAVLDAMDQQLGTLFDRIRNSETLRDNTLIIFASDNGHEEGAGQSDPLRGAKTWLYEGGIRSPLIVWGPGLVQKSAVGSTNDTSVLCALDVNASLYDIAGISVPDNANLDGESLADTLLGKNQNSRKAPIFWRRPPDRPGTRTQDNPDLAVRDGKWKFHINYDGSDVQLYDLSQDISESTNLAGEHPDVVARLKLAVFAWNKDLPVDAGDPGFVAPKSADTVGTLPADQFLNPIGEGGDPWVIRDPHANRFLWCFSEGNRAIAVHVSDRLTSLGTKHIVWTAPETGPVSREVWAPELHYLDSRWHIFFAASDGRNENHLGYVLVSADEDPLSEYSLHGPFATGDGADGRSPNLWAIDMTVLEHSGRRYAIWSGWDAPGTDQQFLYIAPMKSPIELAGPRVRLSANNDYPWEFTENAGKGRGLNEGPQILQHGGRTFLLYSCAASWLPTYKLGMLELVGDDPLNPNSWTKFPKPVFRGTDQTSGVGHSCFVQREQSADWWHVYHAKQDRNPGWRRAVYVQPMRFDDHGTPLFGRPVHRGQPLPRPSGESEALLSLPLVDKLNGTVLQGWDYFGHHQFIRPSAQGLRLGAVPEHPVNDYRCGEKVIFRQIPPSDTTAEVTIDFQGHTEARDAGILLRTSGSSIGYDSQRGYFAGILPQAQRVIFGRTDGQNWKELGRADVRIDATVPQKLRVTANGENFELFVNDKSVLSAADATYTSGQVGLRVVDTDAVFSDFRVE